MKNDSKGMVTLPLEEYEKIQQELKRLKTDVENKTSSMILYYKIKIDNQNNEIIGYDFDAQNVVIKDDNLNQILKDINEYGEYLLKKQIGKL